MSVEQRLWATPDGALCVLRIRNDAPHFEVLVLRAGTVLARRRFYAQASAYMLGESWRPASASALPDTYRPSTAAPVVEPPESCGDAPVYLPDWPAHPVAEAVEAQGIPASGVPQPF